LAVLNPMRGDSDSINVLDWLDPASDSVIENAQTVVNWLSSGEPARGDNQHFEEEGRKLVLTLLLHTIFNEELSAEEKTLRTVRGYIVSGNLTAVLAEIAAKNAEYAYGVAPQYANELLEIADTAEKQWAGIRGHASQFTGWLTQPNLARLVCGDCNRRPPLRTADLIEGDTDFFICIPMKTLDATAGPARLILGALLNIKYEASYLGTDSSEKVLFLLDEMPRLRKMELLETARDAGRGAGIVLWSIIQDLGQLERYYEKTGAQSWFENAQVKSFFGIGSIETAKMLSEMLDKRTIEVMSTGNSNLKDTTGNLNRQHIGRNLMTPGEILNMAVDENGDPDEQIVIIRNHPPLRCGMAKWYRRREWKDVLDNIKRIAV